MTLAPLPGVPTKQLLETLAERLESLQNSYGAKHTGTEKLLDYASWAATTASMLSFQMSKADVEWLIEPDAAWRLSGVWSLADKAVVADIARYVVEARIRHLKKAHTELAEQMERWGRPAGGRLIVPDSTLFMNHPQKIRDMVLADDLPERGVPLRLVLPIIVIDELDGLKRSGDRHVRWRAGHTLGVLDELLTDGQEPARLRERDDRGFETGAILRGEVTVEVLFDPPDHHRLPINDDEIIDRALAVQRVAGRSVTLVTYDSGQSTRARSVDLKVMKLTKPIGDEPQPKSQRDPDRNRVPDNTPDSKKPPA